MSAAITWSMTKRTEPPYGSVLARGTSLEVCFIVMETAAIRLTWDGTGWLAQWGHYGADAHRAAVLETEELERHGFELTGAFYSARSHLGPSGLYALSTRGDRVDLRGVLVDPWERIGEVA